MVFTPIRLVTSNHQKKQSEECVFCNLALKIVPCCQKYTPLDCLFSDFAHWDAEEV